MAGDPLGFSRQTATILRGLGAEDLIEECARRNVSTNDLHRLTKQDLIALGASEEKAEELHRALAVRTKPTRSSDSDELLDRLRDLSVTAFSGEQQLRLLAAYVAYARLRLNEEICNQGRNQGCKERVNPFIDADRAFSASEALPLAVGATLPEIAEAERKLGELMENVARKERRSARLDTGVFILAATALATLGALAWAGRPTLKL